MKLSLIVITLCSLASAVKMEQHHHAKRDVVMVTATINGAVVSWAQTNAGGAGGSPTAAPDAGDGTTTRTHYQTVTVHKNQKRHGNQKRDSVVPVTATINGEVATWMQTIAGGSGQDFSVPPSYDSSARVTTTAVPVKPQDDQKAVSVPSWDSGSSSYSSSEPSSSPSSEPSSGHGSGSGTGSVSVDGDLEAFSEPTKKFVDGTILCDTFPSGQGVIPVPWVGLDNWSSIQQQEEGGSQSKTCLEGLLCLYACQAGMLKTQYPSAQPANGESRGGLLCKGGKLYRTNKNLDYLCEWGKNTANAVSKLLEPVALCRTDYPGSENMVVPTLLEAGGTKPISVVDEKNYYTWKGGMTSSQYYVNNAGVSVEDGCIWSSSDAKNGNWAPVVLGAGYDGSTTWLLITPNPNNKTPPNYKLKILGDVSAECTYSGGSLNKNSGDGCTVAVTLGTASFVFY